MEAHDSADVLAKIVASLATRLASSAGERAIHHDTVARCERRDLRAHGDNLAGSFCADDQRQLALGESHATEAPHVEVIERDGLDGDLHLTGSGRRWCSDVRELNLAIGN